ncbi:MAG TPA: hypothetical protein VGQ99_04460 [Tepidisphaeraceae bacterium]|nr:hypothetical protein [Tepidisphaeraceae bacterium]
MNVLAGTMSETEPVRGEEGAALSEMQVATEQATGKEGQAESLRTRMIHIAAMALVACIAVWHGWRPGFVLAPTDALRMVAPWGEAGKDYIPRNEGLLDQTVQFVPWTIYAVERLKKGEIPLWNPYSQLGAPFVGNGQSAIFYPTMLLHVLLSPTWSWTISAALKLFVAGLGVWVLVGRYGLAGAPRLLSAVAFMLCGFNVVWLNHPQANVSAMLPWAVLVVEMMIERVTLMRVLGGALVFAMQFLGGHPGTCIHLLVTCGLVWLFRVVGGMKPSAEADPTGRHKWRARRSLAMRSGGAMGAAVGFGFALAAMQWLPLMEYAAHSGANVVRRERLAAQRFIATDPQHLIGILFPYANGYPDGVMPFELRKATKLPNTNELAPGWVGTIPLVLGVFAALALWRRHATVKMWGVMGIVAAAIGINFPLLDNVVRRIPGLGMAQNARLLLTTALALSILAGFGMEELMQRVNAGIDSARLRKVMANLAWIAVALAAAGAGTLLASKAFILQRGYGKAEAEYRKTAVHEHTLTEVKGVVDRVHAELVRTSLRLLIPATMLGAGAYWIGRAMRQAQVGDGSVSGRAGPTREKAVGWGMLALALIDLLVFAIPFNPGAPAETYFPKNVAAIEKLKSLPEARMAGTFRTMMPETATAYGLADLRGYDALGPVRYYKWWEHPGIGQLPKDWYGYLLQLRNPEHPAWGLLNFGYVVSAVNQPAPNPEKFELVSRGEDAVIYKAKEVRPRAWVAPFVEKYDRADEVLDRVAKMDFNPDRVVLVDRQIEDESNRRLVEDQERKMQLIRMGGPAFVEFVQQKRPEVVSVLVSGGGWLVVADSYFPGWTATIIEENGKETAAPIWPAFGVMRAVPVPASEGPVIVEMRYRPRSWSVGSRVSAGAWGLVAILGLGGLVMRGLGLRGR